MCQDELLIGKEPNLSVSSAINLTRQLMDGYKLEFLILRHSFYLWWMASSVSFGLANFYVLPAELVLRQTESDKPQEVPVVFFIFIVDNQSINRDRCLL